VPARYGRASTAERLEAITDEVVGRVGRVTGTVGPGRVGEVMLAVRGGSEHFHAHPCDGKTFAVGTRVVVVEYYPPRTVIVAEA
jgi:arginine utilization protein RocB